MLRDGTASSYGDSVFNLGNNCQSVPKQLCPCTCPPLHPSWDCLEGTGVTCDKCQVVCGDCLSQMANDATHLFMSLLVLFGRMSVQTSGPFFKIRSCVLCFKSSLCILDSILIKYAIWKVFPPYSIGRLSGKHKSCSFGCCSTLKGLSHSSVWDFMSWFCIFQHTKHFFLKSAYSN